MRSEPGQRSLSVAVCGLLLVGIAAFVGLEGLIQSPQAIRPLPGLGLMQPVNAAAFLLYGAALALVGLDLTRRIAMACALGGLSLALLALLALVARGLGLDPAFARAFVAGFLAHTTAHPGGMSPETAFGLIAAGVGLVWRTSDRLPMARPLAVSLLGVAAAALGLAVGSLLVLQLHASLHVYEGGMALKTAVALVLLGSGLVLSTTRIRSPDALEPLGVQSLAVGLSSLLVALAIASVVAVQRDSERDRRAAAHLARAVAVIETHIQGDIEALELMRARWRYRPSRAEWEDDARNYLASHSFVELAVYGAEPGVDWSVGALDAAPLPPDARAVEPTRAVLRLPLGAAGAALVGVFDLAAIEEQVARTLPPGYSVRLRTKSGTTAPGRTSPGGIERVHRALPLGADEVHVTLEHSEPSLLLSRGQMAGLALSLALPLFLSLAWQLSSTALRRGHALGASEASRSEQSERLRVVLERGGIGTWGIEIDSGQTWVDKHTADLFGLEPSDAVDTEIFMAQVHPEDQARVRRGLRAAVRGRLAYDEAFRVCRADGTVRHAIGQAELVPSASGQGLRLIGITLDVTRNRQIEDLIRELERSNRELEEFAYAASHDLQEPLRMVASYMQLFERRYRGQLDQEADKFIHFAVDGAQRMQALVNDLLHYSRAGRGTVPDVPVDTDRILQTAIENLHIKIQQEGAQVSWDALPRLRGSEPQLVVVFQNLIENAVKYHGDEPARVHVGVEEREGRTLLYVRDNGIGFDPSQAERIFRLFQRLHERGRYPGTGIGLALVARIVSRHRGHVWAESSPGNGATFFLELPTVEDDSKPPF